MVLRVARSAEDRQICDDILRDTGGDEPFFRRKLRHDMMRLKSFCRPAHRTRRHGDSRVVSTRFPHRLSASLLSYRKRQGEKLGVHIESSAYFETVHFRSAALFELPIVLERGAHGLDRQMIGPRLVFRFPLFPLFSHILLSFSFSCVPQFVEVRRKEKMDAAGLQRLNAGGHEGDRRLGFCARAQLVANHEAAFPRVAQDASQLRHFHYKRGHPRPHVVVAEDAREESRVGHESHRRRGDGHSQLRHQNREAQGLAEAAFARGVDAVQEQAAGRRGLVFVAVFVFACFLVKAAKGERMRDVGRPCVDSLHNGMPHSHDVHAAFLAFGRLDIHGPYVAVQVGGYREAAVDVNVRNELDEVGRARRVRVEPRGPLGGPQLRRPPFPGGPEGEGGGIGGLCGLRRHVDAATGTGPLGLGVEAISRKAGGERPAAFGRRQKRKRLVVLQGPLDGVGVSQRLVPVSFRRHHVLVQDAPPVFKGVQVRVEAAAPRMRRSYRNLVAHDGLAGLNARDVPPGQEGGDVGAQLGRVASPLREEGPRTFVTPAERDEVGCARGAYLEASKESGQVADALELRDQGVALRGEGSQGGASLLSVFQHGNVRRRLYAAFLQGPLPHRRRDALEQPVQQRQVVVGGRGQRQLMKGVVSEEARRFGRPHCVVGNRGKERGVVVFHKGEKIGQGFADKGMTFDVEEMLERQGAPRLEDVLQKIEAGSVRRRRAVGSGCDKDVDVGAFLPKEAPTELDTGLITRFVLVLSQPRDDDLDGGKECQKGPEAVHHRFSVEEKQVEFGAPQEARCHVKGRCRSVPVSQSLRRIRIGFYTNSEEDPVFPTSSSCSLVFVQIGSGTADATKGATRHGAAFFGLIEHDDGVAGGHEHSFVFREGNFRDAPTDALSPRVVGGLGLRRAAARRGGGLDVCRGSPVSYRIVHFVELSN